MSEEKSPYQHYLDASYEAWRRGVNSDRVDIDRCYDDYYDGRTPEQTVGDIERSDRQARERRDEQAAEEDYCAEQARQEYEWQQSQQPPPAEEPHAK